MLRYPAKIFVIALLTFQALSCNKNDPGLQHPVPHVTVNRQINMDNALFTKLNTPGGYVYLEGEGYKGIIVTRDFADNFNAVDRACPYHPDEACAKATVEKSGISILCGSYTGNDFTACCDSRYGLDGSLQQGPSQHPLRAYYVSRSGSVLTITNY